MEFAASSGSMLFAKGLNLKEEKKLSDPSGVVARSIPIAGAQRLGVPLPPAGGLVQMRIMSPCGGGVAGGPEDLSQAAGGFKTRIPGGGNRHREEKLALCRQLLGMPDVDPEPVPGSQPSDYDIDQLYEKLTGSSLRQCPICHQGRMVVVEILAPASPEFIDTS